MSSFSTYSSKAVVAAAAGEVIHHIRRLSSSSSKEENPFQSEMHWRLPMLGVVLVVLAVGFFILDAIIRCVYRNPYGHQQAYFQPPPQRILPVMSIEPALNFSSGLTLAGGADHHPECTICLSEFVEGEKIRILSKCKHGFHDKCIETWLRSRTSCPTCRTSCVKTSIDKNPPENHHQQQQQQQQNDIDLEAANRPETEMMVLQQQQPPNDIDVEAANQSETEILSRSSA